VRAVGYGSASARLLALDQVGQLAPQFDEIGRRNAIRDKVAAYVGYSQADRYAPSLASGQAGRQPRDKKEAEIENALLSIGQPMPVDPEDIPKTHIMVHMIGIHNIIFGIKQGTLQAMQGSQQLHMFLNHIVGHVQQLTADPTRFQEVRLVNRGLNLVEGFLTQLDHNIAEAQAAIARQGEQAAQAQAVLAQRAQMGQLPGGVVSGGGPVTGGGGGRTGPVAQSAGVAPNVVSGIAQTTATRYAQNAAAAQGQPPLDPKLISDLQAHQIKMQIMKDESDLKSQILADQGRQKIAFEDARMARRIAREAQLMGIQASRGKMGQQPTEGIAEGGEV
jgi:hypothetical protein